MRPKKAYVGKISLAPPVAAHKNSAKTLRKVQSCLSYSVYSLTEIFRQARGASVPATFGQKSAKIGCIGVLEPPNGLTLRIFP